MASRARASGVFEGTVASKTMLSSAQWPRRHLEATDSSAQRPRRRAHAGILEFSRVFSVFSPMKQCFRAPSGLGGTPSGLESTRERCLRAYSGLENNAFERTVASKAPPQNHAFKRPVARQAPSRRNLKFSGCPRGGPGPPKLAKTPSTPEANDGTLNIYIYILMCTRSYL